MRAFNSKWNYEKDVFFVRVPQNLGISRSCFAEDDETIYKDL